jgi:tyrosine-specific transport protein
MKYSKTKEKPVIPHLGVFHRELTMWQAVALIVASTVGAGVLALPYAIARVGIFLGIIYIVGAGLLLMGLNLLLGEVALRTGRPLQLAGLAREYLGKTGQVIMTIVFYTSVAGALLAYIIGEGVALRALFGGGEVFWSLLFFVVGSIVVFAGIRTIKSVELWLTIAMIFVVILIGALSVPHLSFPYFTYVNLAFLFFPYGVVLFAFSGINAIPEAYTLLRGRAKEFRKAIVFSSVIVTVLYLFFAITIVGVTGLGTTEIATIGLGASIGPIMNVFGNVFAVLAMGTSFVILALALRDSLHWDFKVPERRSTFLVLGIPFVVFLLGARQFVAVLDIVGGVFVSIEMALVVFIYLAAKKHGSIKKSPFHLHNTLWLVVALLLAFSVGTVYSVLTLF